MSSPSAPLQIIPETAFYRQDLEKLTKYRMKVVAEHEDVSQQQDMHERGSWEGVHAVGSATTSSHVRIGHW